MLEGSGNGLVAAAWEKLERLIAKLHATNDDDLSAGLRLQIKELAQELKAVGATVPDAFPHRQWVQLYLPEIAPPPSYNDEPPAPSDPSPEPQVIPSESAQSVHVRTPADLPEDASLESNGDSATVDASAVEAAENLLRRAKVSQMRGNKQEAYELIQEAARTAPQSSSVLEALGDELLAQRKTKEARTMFLRAHQADPKNVSAERKHAELVFDTQVRTMDLTRYSDSEVMASSKSSAILSLFIPGLGQLVLGEVLKGILYMVVAVGCWILAVQLGMLQIFASIAGKTQKDVHPAAFVCSAVAIMTHIVASVDASSRGKAVQKRKPERPEPPANLPFE